MSEPRMVGPDTQAAARAFVAALREEFDRQEGSNIVAAWTTHGILIVACQGWKADRLAAVINRENLAIVGGTPPPRDGASGG